jgi:hypothetical protein
MNERKSKESEKKRTRFSENLMKHGKFCHPKKNTQPTYSTINFTMKKREK